MYVRLSASVQDKKQNKTSPHSRSRSVRYYDGSVYDDQPTNQKKTNATTAKEGGRGAANGVP